MEQQGIVVMAKVAIAAAWADGTIQPAEVEILKQSLAKYDLPRDVWNELNLYLQGQIGESERALLLEELQTYITTDAEKREAIGLIGSIVQADDQLAGREEEIGNDLQAAIAAVDTGFFAKLKGFFKR